MARIIFLIGLGGALGCIARFLTAKAALPLNMGSFPLGTFAANILGCLFIGLIYGLGQRYGWMTVEWRFFLATGFCGGFTTFSTFSFENIEMLQQGQYGSFFLYTLLSLTLGLGAVFSGLWLAKS